MRLIVTVALTLLFATPALCAPKADLWTRWQTHDENATAHIDHSRFDAFLKKYVVVHEHGPNGVRYGKVTAKDKQALESYIQAMQKIKIDDYDRDTQYAYWINLYNAVTLDLVLDAYPVDSIRDVGGGVFSSGPWKKKLLTVEGEKLSLNDIEHRILRPIWHDPLTHYGVNCAAMGCPSLRRDAYTGDNVYDALRENAKDFVNSPEGVEIKDGKVTVSRIYDWYAEDFGHSETAIVSQLRRHAAPALSARLDMLHRIDGYQYDWALNDEAAMQSTQSGDH